MNQSVKSFSSWSEGSFTQSSFDVVFSQEHFRVQPQPTPASVYTMINKRNSYCSNKYSHGVQDYLVQQYTRFNKQSDYVYKLCCSEWLVIMKKLPSTKTNETRTNIHTTSTGSAKFRASKLHVVKIINIHNATTCDSIINHNYAHTVYTVGKIVVPDAFDSNLNSVCTNGIHYFKTIKAALMYRHSTTEQSDLHMATCAQTNHYQEDEQTTSIDEDSNKNSNKNKFCQCSLSIRESYLESLRSSQKIYAHC